MPDLRTRLDSLGISIPEAAQVCGVDAATVEGWLEASELGGEGAVRLRWLRLPDASALAHAERFRRRIVRTLEGDHAAASVTYRDGGAAS
jgi:hypothetical protein